MTASLRARRRVTVLLAAAISRELLRRWWTLRTRVVDWVLRRPARQYDVTGADELYEVIGLVCSWPVAVLPAVGRPSRDDSPRIRTRRLRYR